MGHNVANVSPPMRRFFEKSCMLLGRNDAEMGTPTRYTLRRFTASITKKSLFDFVIIETVEIICLNVKMEIKNKHLENYFT